MSSYQNNAQFARDNRGFPSQTYVKWALFKHEQLVPGEDTAARSVVLHRMSEHFVDLAMASAVYGQAVSMSEIMNREWWEYIPAHRRREWLDEFGKLVGQEFPPEPQDYVHDCWMHDIVEHVSTCGPDGDEYEQTKKDGQAECVGEYVALWLHDEEWGKNEEVQEFRRFHAVASRYMGGSLPYTYFDTEWPPNAYASRLVHRCPITHRLAFTIELARIHEDYKKGGIARFLDGAAGSDNLPACLEALKSKTAAELDTIVRWATYGEDELDELFPELGSQPTPPPRMLVERLIPDRCVTIAYGDTGSGKTYFVLEVAAAVADNRPAFGHLPIAEPGVVVYFCGEDPDPFVVSRVEAVQRAHGDLTGKLRVVKRVLPLDDDATLDQYLAGLARLQAKLRAEGRRIAMVVIDTLGKMINTLNDRDPRTANKFASVTRGIVSEFGCAVLVTAHDTKSGDELAGTKVFLNDASWTLHIRGSHTAEQLLTSVKVEQGANDKARVSIPIVPFTVRCQPVALPAPVNGHETDIVLVDYVEKRKPPKSEIEVDRKALARDRLAAGESQTKVSRDLNLNKAVVNRIAKELLQ